MTIPTPDDAYWMQQAISLSSRAIYRTKPNPNVGCVLVKDQQIVGEGFHPRAGEPHAEVFALRAAGQHSVAATAYVTLEPCAHYGRTPPCAEALIQAQVSRVVIACHDPNPLVAGKGIAMLEAAGIAVTCGVLEQQAKAYNLGFLKAMSTGMPYVRLKIAASLDGRTAMASGESKWITGPEARADVQHWRALSGAIITGIDTVLADDCLLNVRSLQHDNVSQIVQPMRIILDRQGRLPLSASILAQPDSVMVMGPYRAELEALGVRQIAIQPLPELLAYLCQSKQFYDIMVEAGSRLSTAFLNAGVVDELIYYIAPCLLGNAARPMYQHQIMQLSEKLAFDCLETQQIGADTRLRLRFKGQA